MVSETPAPAGRGMGAAKVVDTSCRAGNVSSLVNGEFDDVMYC